MEFILTLINLILHIDQHLVWLVQNYGIWIYFIVFLIIFCETGLVVTPFLPGDSLLFALGAIAAIGSLNITLLIILLSIAAILGDTVNYWIGNWFGPGIIHKRKIKFLKKEYLEKTQRFYEKYGVKTVIFARFVPIVRTFAPFLAGVGSMKYSKFISYNIIGGLSWISVFLLGGYFFGNIPIIKENFTFVIIAIIIISFMPAIIEYIKHKRESIV
ncbi:DedA family protein [Candidatus Woesearchaeota archaeon]|nr:DedA family protein [Candidatus Woesearchaeota archaeon]